jgi:hypothetical protein
MKSPAATLAPPQGLQGLHAFLAAQGLQGLHGFFFAAQGLQGLQAFLAAHGLQGLQAFLAAHGLQGLHFLAAQGLHGLQAAANISVGFLTAGGLLPAIKICVDDTATIPPSIAATMGLRWK